MRVNIFEGRPTEDHQRLLGSGSNDNTQLTTNIFSADQMQRQQQPQQQSSSPLASDDTLNRLLKAGAVLALAGFGVHQVAEAMQTLVWVAAFVLAGYVFFKHRGRV